MRPKEREIGQRGQAHLVLLLFRHVPVPFEFLFELATGFFVAALLRPPLELDVEVLVGASVSRDSHVFDGAEEPWFVVPGERECDLTRRERH